MSVATQPIDQDARTRISESGLEETLFVEAGAGTGKTTQLVSRIVNTVVRNDVALADIAAITFTEAAATELQARIRVAFEKRLADPNTPDETRDRCRRAVADADMAAISTVHGFASRILNEFSVSANLPPRVTVLDEVSSQLANERRWDRFVDRLHQQPDRDELLYRAALMEIPLQPRWDGQATFKDVAANFSQNWDRLGDLDAEGMPALEAIDFGEFDRAIDALAASVASCTDPADKLAVHIGGTCLPEMRALASIPDPHQKLRSIGQRLQAASKRRIWGRTSFGSKKSWTCDTSDIKDLIEAVSDAAANTFDAAGVAVVDQLMRLTATEVLDAANERRRDGGLEFHDLLVLARQALRRNPEVRRSLHERYRHILLDEFQDTDPIQIEVASLIAADPSDTQPERWEEHPVSSGRLFFVGDPKQSIYRFRRADIKLFLAARDAFGGGSGPVVLRTNFRTVRPIIDWVNAVFTEVMPEEIPEAQPKYEPLDAWREADSGADHRPIVFGGEHPDPKVKAGVLREAEAADVGDIVAAIAARPENWPVFDQVTSQWRSARLSDVTILIPTRTSLPYLRDALERREVPYRLATGTLVYDTQEVRDLLAALRAIDDPNDTLSLVAALRSPLYGCSDVDLFTYHQANRRWDLRSRAPDSLVEGHPVVAALEHLRSLWDQRWWLSPATMMDRLLRERRAFLLAYGDPRPVEVWRRLRFLLDQARSFEESNGGDLRAFLEWASLQSADGARVHEPMLPETDEEALQILTVHGSKGLEFPITILSGMTTKAGGRRGGVSVLWSESGPPEVKLRSGVATAAHQPRADLEEEMGRHEKLRLLYVAATRARDHLVVSGHHKASPKDPDATFATRLASFASRSPDLCRPHEIAGANVAPATPTVTESAAVVDAEEVIDRRTSWIDVRRALVASFASPTAVSATAIAGAADTDIADVDDDTRDAGERRDGSTSAPIIRRKGRAGSSIGRAVHATLEYIDFADPTNVRDLVDRQCDLEAIPEHGDTVEALVRSALGSDAVVLAQQHHIHRELYVAAPFGAVTVEGYVDLLIRTPDGLVIVDYKTDTVSTDAAVDAKVAAYELQGAAYALALEATTGIPVIDCRFVFCNARGAIERSVRDLDTVMQRVRESVGAA
ncbi:MAG: UvrD-helicase domain-containing protein [Ilumatobacter sp.]|uniref:UvrD-helicase domain-containing protein n=1 Tax=Ilumatobacter sp. TaxID=1967498 RepID=UPI003C708AF4